MAKKSKTIVVEGQAIALFGINNDDYISLTDIDSRFDGAGRHIENWIRNQNTIEYLETWELLHNPNFNSMGLHGIKEKIGLNRFILSIKQWVKETNAIGIKAKAGRYGGTYAHFDIALNFCLWISPRFQLYVAKEFKRLKEQEARERYDNLHWDLRRTLSKINYTVHTDAIKETLIPPRLTRGAGLIYASEADILNLALFGKTAKQWRTENPEAKGNMRDDATTEQLIVLANLEAINAELIRNGLGQEERIIRLNEAAITQLRSILSSPSTSKLPPPLK